ncbi:PAS domain-containing protein, partial [Salmonella enterica subsp. enterica serovar Kentucky]|nr:PAS domain-containing protein [Salmonella enterica subsp. enterica serovar Kentucky]
KDQRLAQEASAEAARRKSIEKELEWVRQGAKGRQSKGKARLATLKQGEPWSGIVKNRRKNGDHYWVRANAVPMIREGRVTGYMS